MPALRLPLCFLAVSLFTVSSFADILDVSVTGSVNVNGSFNNGILECANFPQDFSLGGANSLEGLGAYSLTKSGSEDCTPFFEPYNSASASQTADVTSTSLTLATDVSASSQGANGTFFVFSSAGASSTLTITFDLSEPSVMDLTGSIVNKCENPIFFFSGCPSDAPLSGDAEASVELTGPGVDITQTNGSFTLDPGHYVLTASNFASSDTDIAVDSFSDLSLGAEFREIPEPRWLIVLPILLLLLLHRDRSHLAKCPDQGPGPQHS
jgi:hypothetical protein